MGMPPFVYPLVLFNGNIAFHWWMYLNLPVSRNGHFVFFQSFATTNSVAVNFLSFFANIWVRNFLNVEFLGQRSIHFIFITYYQLCSKKGICEVTFSLTPLPSHCIKYFKFFPSVLEGAI